MGSMPIHKALFYLTILLLPTQLAYHHWTEFSMILGRNVDYLVPTIYVTDIFVIGTLVAYGIHKRNRILYVAGRTVRNFLATPHTNTYILLFFIIFVFINTVLSKNISVTLFRWLKFAELALFVLYIKHAGVHIRTSLLFLMVGLSLTSSLAVVQTILGHSVGGVLYMFGERTFTVDTPGIARFSLCLPFRLTCREILRGYGTLPHPNVLAGMLASSIPAVLLLLPVLRASEVHKNYRILWEKGVRIFFMVSGFLALIVSFGRSAIFVTCIGIVVSLTFLIRRHAYRTRFMIIALGVILALIFLLILRINVQDESFVLRRDLNRAAVSIWQTSPFVGVGLGNFLTQLPHVYAARTIFFLQPVHNIYLLVLSEGGFVGLSFFVYGIYALFRVIRHLKKRSIRNGFFWAVISMLILGFIDHYALTLQQPLFLCALYVGLILHLHARNDAAI